MNKELAHAIRVAVLASVWLRGDGGVDAPQDIPDDQAWAHVAQVTFAAGNATERHALADWLTDLRTRGNTRVYLAIGESGLMPTLDGKPIDRVELTHHVNLGGYGLLATGPKHTESWHPTWTVGAPGAADGRPWWVHYRGVDATGVDPQRPDVAATTTALREVLVHARDYCTRYDLEDRWVTTFQESLDAAPSSYEADLLPASWPEDARALGRMAARAWVFGGMGSWNDAWLTEQAPVAEYDAITKDLLAAVLQACLAATNCELVAAA